MKQEIQRENHKSILEREREIQIKGVEEVKDKEETQRHRLIET